MSTIFGHGRLRLYLLKLLDESPRHGYEIISLLRDRFLGVYSPSPGTIYPRLARLEEEGLVTHTEEGGRKVYRLTDRGREELRERESDLDALEREITDSVRDIARAVKQDVRATISSLRDELKFSSGGARRSGPGAPRGSAGPESAEGGTTPPEPEEGARTDEREERERGCEDASRWTREWERFAQGFGAVWARGGSERQHSEFDHALRDFSDRVRDVVRGAGHVGEAAATDLRRILDETVEVIRRDVRHWGPPADRAEDGAEGADGSAPPRTDGEPHPSREEAGSGTGEEAGEDASEHRGEKARPMPSSDPWSQAVEDTGQDT